jgi:hypothetical protein
MTDYKDVPPPSFKVGDYVVIDAASYGARGSVYRINAHAIGWLYDVKTGHTIEHDGQQVARVIENVWQSRLTPADVVADRTSL